MKTKAEWKAACWTIVMMAAALCVPNAFSQGRAGRGGAPAARPAYVPVGNPVGPMTNPVAPIIQSPFLPHPATTPAAPNSGRGGAPYVDHRRVIGAPYYAPYYPAYSAPYYDYGYLQGIPTTITIPGLPPGARYEDYIDPRTEYNHAASSDPYFDAPPEPAPAITIYYVYEPEPNRIIREPQPNRVVHPPAVGTSRPDVILQFGQPWGSFKCRGIETLYFDDVTVVLGTDGRVTSARETL